MKIWKVWFRLGQVRFAMEFKGDFNEVCEAASQLAKKLGVGFDYDIDNT